MKILISDIKQAAKTGMPCGEEDFIKRIEGIVGRRLKALMKGRPKKEK